MNMTVKNLPEPTYLVLKEEAQRTGHSLNSKLIQILAREAQELERRRKMRESRPGLERFVASQQPQPSSVSLIREDREER